MLGMAVTSENCAFGLKVRRGKDWKWGSQDFVGGKESIGTITRCKEDNWTNVQWDGGISAIYRIGDNGYFDLSISSMYLKLYIKSKYKYIFTFHRKKHMK